ncbi:HAD family phosphatase [Clostridium celatum]|uniref:HAD hydrolase, family IA, variant 3 n=1 Tax=Clostridium celatum DSM 1785 TaxID=545697 RepID=L1QDZ3_9CLOT|nr:HAD family phosphatase [Clostridium celatum]EKY26208.1 HAD hydrolase, family IA, variant 3 [Clostridium celatum DSM 1785]MCE9656357.1 HAD family phosphatase [Clostridium celatum]MDU3722168.1 HAD family phosphatase [Clostridium celatum]MDU6295249.1 HAD family phosphatase [Clostridium celatum]MDY3360711.1 HAD family phosphatase [Clostridium celatum]
MYKNIIFDLGNVVLNYNPEEYLIKKINDKNKVEIALNNIFKSNEWKMLDRGIITEEEAKRVIKNRVIDNSEIIDLAFENWYDMLRPIEETIELINKLKKNGYKIYYLSNFHSKAFEEVTNKNKVFEEFYGGIVSFKEKLLKPEKEIYMKLLEEYNLNPEECIFIDDMLINIEGAKAVNIKGIQFISTKDLIYKLRECGVEI